MKKIVSIVLLAALLLSLVPQALAYSFSDHYAEYVVESQQPKGYCYLYDEPSDVYGRNLGRHDNGEIVKVIAWDEKGYFLVVCQDEKWGYMHDYALKFYRGQPVEQGQSHQPQGQETWPAYTAPEYSYYDTKYPLYVVESYEPNGYCYLYDEPSDIYGWNLGRHNNGELVRVIRHDSSNGGYYFVICSDGKTGYIHDYALTFYVDKITRVVYQVYSTNPRGYCYLYDQPSDIYGTNLGRYNNGEYVEIVDWNASDVYAKVFCLSTQKYGYIRKTCLRQVNY